MAPKKSRELNVPAPATSAAAEPAKKPRASRSKTGSAASPARHHSTKTAAPVSAAVSYEVPPAVPSPLRETAPFIERMEPVAAGPVLVKAPARRAAASTDKKALSEDFPRLHEHIAVRAYFNWLERGCPHGSAEADWFQAEQDLLMLDRALRHA